MTRKIISGNQAAAYGVHLARTQVVASYPITPQTSVMETLADMWSTGEFKGTYVSVESEHSVLSYCVGAAYAGARTFTATSSHGLAYMHEIIHWGAGSRLPLVMVNVNRALGAPWCIESDQLDSLSQRDTGWLQIYCSSAQEILDTVVQAFRIAEEAMIPCMVVYDGFVLSHTYEPVDMPNQEQVDRFLPPPPDKPVVSPSNPQNINALAMADCMADLIQTRFTAVAGVEELIRQVDDDYKNITGRGYSLIETHGLPGAKILIITAGAMSQTVKVLLPELSEEGEEVGLARLRLFRPFPKADICKIFEENSIEKVLVIDRNVSMGVGGIFAQEVKAALMGEEDIPPIFELNLAGGLDLTPEMMRKSLERLKKLEPQDEKIIWGVRL